MIFTNDHPMVVLIRIKDRLIAANNALAVAAQMSADSLETLGEPQKANFLRRSTTDAARAAADSTTEFAEILRQDEDSYILTAPGQLKRHLISPETFREKVATDPDLDCEVRPAESSTDDRH